MSKFMQAAIEEAKKGLSEGGIPIGSVLVHKGKIIGRGHNRRVQNGSTILHGKWTHWKMLDGIPQSFTANVFFIPHYLHVQCVLEPFYFMAFQK